MTVLEKPPIVNKDEELSVLDIDEVLTRVMK